MGLSGQTERRAAHASVTAVQRARWRGEHPSRPPNPPPPWSVSGRRGRLSVHSHACRGGLGALAFYPSRPLPLAPSTPRGHRGFRQRKISRLPFACAREEISALARGCCAPSGQERARRCARHVTGAHTLQQQFHTACNVTANGVLRNAAAVPMAASGRPLRVARRGQA